MLQLPCRGAGGRSDPALHQNWMRDYDPTTGRYIQADPLGLVDGASVYGYALQNPGRYVDPRGESVFGWLCDNSAIIGASPTCKALDHCSSGVAGGSFDPEKPDTFFPPVVVTDGCDQCTPMTAADCYEEYEDRNDSCRRMFPRTDAGKRRRQQCWQESSEELARCLKGAK
ncbi:RHS repeat domain-containing protein [Aliiroseovarius sp.]|uniref:RHS repeat domain-containing protein n=1 Tax=Aliiroseovarius sp. TaxID=1872442 RepID=UPI003BAD51AA